MRKIPLQFSDIDFGTEEFGFIPVEPGEDPDDADRRYERHLAAQGVVAQVDPMGNLVVEGAGRRGTLRLTEGQLRRIIQEEVRSLTEMPTRSGGMGRGEAKAALLAAAREVREMFLTPSGKPMFKAPRLDKGVVFMMEDSPRENYRGKPAAKKVADELKKAFVALGGTLADQNRLLPGTASIICRDTTGTPNDVGLMVRMAIA